jgi:hypothetical protein
MRTVLCVPLPDEATRVTRKFLELIDNTSPRLVQGLYLRGSLAFGEYFPGRSDVDFAAVLAARPDAGQLDALGAAHAAVHEACPSPHFDGFHLIRSDLAKPPGECPDLPCMFEGSFRPAERFDVNPVSWHELARRGVTVRGPELTEETVWTDDAALRAFTHGNLSSYWARVADLAVEHSAEAAKPEVVAWCVLGVSRLHHLLATGTMTSKSGAGRYALAAFGPRWHPIIQEALRAREDPDRPSEFDGEADRRGGVRLAAAWRAAGRHPGPGRVARHRRGSRFRRGRERADLIAMKADPTQAVSALRRLHWV